MEPELKQPHTSSLRGKQNGACFPHNALGGISPADLPAEASAQAGKLLEHQSQSPLYECPECKLKYREKKWAKACEAWCKEHHSCNLQITTQAENDQ